MKIVVLTSETPACVWLVNQLLSRRHVAGIVIERRALALTRSQKIDRRWRLLQRHGALRVVNKLLYNWFRSRFLSPSESATVSQSFFPGQMPIAFAHDVPTVVVENINDPTAVAFIRQAAPDLIAVCGTRVLKPEVFTLAPKGAVNIHTGITPEYRSADPIFWALYNGEPDNVGVTIHYIDAGIDTGPVIYQERVPVCADDSLASIYVRCIRRGAELYLRALDAIEDGSVRTTKRPDAINRAFRSIDLGLAQYLLFCWRFRAATRRLGARAEIGSTDSRVDA